MSHNFSLKTEKEISIKPVDVGRSIEKCCCNHLGSRFFSSHDTLRHFPFSCAHRLKFCNKHSGLVTHNRVRYLQQTGKFSCDAKNNLPLSGLADLKLFNLLCEKKLISRFKYLLVLPFQVGAKSFFTRENKFRRQHT